MVKVSVSIQLESIPSFIVTVYVPPDKPEAIVVVLV